MAVMVSEPTGREDVANIAEPLCNATAAPRGVPPSLNVTVPVGVVPLPTAGATTAVKVTDVPELTEGAEVISTVMELASVTAGATTSWAESPTNGMPTYTSDVIAGVDENAGESPANADGLSGDEKSNPPSECPGAIAPVLATHWMEDPFDWLSLGMIW